jgi:tyrosine-protein phosphatase OCA1
MGDAPEPPSAPEVTASGDNLALSRPIGGLDDDTDDDRDGPLQYVVTGGALIPPVNYGVVEEGLYRSGLPNELNFPFLEQLQIRTLLHMSTEQMNRQLLNFVDDQGIEVVSLGQAGKALEPVSPDAVISALGYILDPARYPVYVMCSQGRYRTGTVIACLRKLQRWNLASVFEEYRRHAERDKVRISTELFIELFDTDLVRIPEIPVAWYRPEVEALSERDRDAAEYA